MDGTADGYVVTVTPEPVVAGGGAAEAVVAEVGAAEVVAVVDSPKLRLKRARRPQRCGLLCGSPVSEVAFGAITMKANQSGVARKLGRG